MKTKITIVDYGMGNLLSVSRAFEYCGAEVLITDSPVEVSRAERLVLPGVGAFADGMAGLQERGLIQAVKFFSLSDRPLLGICLGMQMLVETSEEFGIHEGLGLIPGKVVAIPKVGTNGIGHKIPHIGWSGLRPSSEVPWEDTILNGIDVGESFYFVHSFSVLPTYMKHRLADCLYNGICITAIIRHKLIYGCQFHPEKSGKMGLKIIQNFIKLK